MAPGILVGSLIGTRIVAMLSTVFLAVFFTCFLFYIPAPRCCSTSSRKRRELCPALPDCLSQVWWSASSRRWWGRAVVSSRCLSCRGATSRAYGHWHLGCARLPDCGVHHHRQRDERLERAQRATAVSRLHLSPRRWSVSSITSVLVAPYGAGCRIAAGRHPKRIFAVLLYVLGLRMLWGVLVA